MNSIAEIVSAIARKEAEFIEAWARQSLKEICGFSDEELAQPIEMITDMLSKRGLRFTRVVPYHSRPYYELFRDTQLIAQLEIKKVVWPPLGVEFDAEHFA